MGFLGLAKDAILEIYLTNQMTQPYHDELWLIQVNLDDSDQLVFVFESVEDYFLRFTLINEDLEHFTLATEDELHMLDDLDEEFIQHTVWWYITDDEGFSEA